VAEEIDVEMYRVVGNIRKFKCSVTLTLTLDHIKVISAYIVCVVLPAYPTM